MRAQALGIIALGVAVAACGDTSDDRIATGGLGGAAAGALVGGPVGAIVGGGVGVAGGAALDKSADEKIYEWANQPTEDGRYMASANGTRTMEPASGAIDGRRVMSMDTIHRKLHDDGYAHVYNIRRDGNTYVARGERAGRVYDIRADAYTGRTISSNDVGSAARHPSRSGSAASNAMNESQVRDALQRNGYEVVGSLTRSGNNYRTQVRHNGETYNVVVDRRAGRIIQATPVQSSSSPGGAATGPARQGG